MRKPLRRSLRGAILGILVAASSAVPVPAQAEPFIYPPAEPSPPIYDPTREIKQKVAGARDDVENTIPPAPVPPDDPVGAVTDTISAAVSGKCLFQGATIEGAATGTLAEQTGIICRVYDTHWVQRGGCATFLPGSAAACAAPTEPLLGPPIVCYEAYAVYAWGTLTEGGCE